jgi:hypothetical protein
VEGEKEEQQMRQSRGGQICEAISRAMQNATETRRNVMLWTQARVNRLKRYFGTKEKPTREHTLRRDNLEVDEPNQEGEKREIEDGEGGEDGERTGGEGEGRGEGGGAGKLEDKK